MCIFWSSFVVSVHADAKSDIRSIETVRSKFTAFNQHDVAAIENIYSSGAVLNSPDYHGLAGNEPIAETYRKLFDAIPDAKDDVESLESTDNHVYVQFVLSGHWHGMQDQPISIHIIAVYTVVDGRIVDDATYYDRKAPRG